MSMDYCGCSGIGCVMSEGEVDMLYTKNHGRKAPRIGDADGCESDEDDDIDDCALELSEFDDGDCEQLDIYGPDDNWLYCKELDGCGRSVTRLLDAPDDPYSIHNGHVFVAFGGRRPDYFHAPYKDVDDIVSDIVERSELFSEDDRVFVRDHLCYVSGVSFG